MVLLFTQRKRRQKLLVHESLEGVHDNDSSIYVVRKAASKIPTSTVPSHQPGSTCANKTDCDAVIPEMELSQTKEQKQTKNEGSINADKFSQQRNNESNDEYSRATQSIHSDSKTRDKKSSASDREQRRDHTRIQEPRKVRFSSVQVQEYALTVGDNPSCKGAFPLTMDWNHTNPQKMSLRRYEYEASTRWSNGFMTPLSEWERLDRLRQVTGLTDYELIYLERQQERHRQQRQTARRRPKNNRRVVRNKH